MTGDFRFSKNSTHNTHFIIFDALKQGDRKLIFYQMQVTLNRLLSDWNRNCLRFVFIFGKFYEIRLMRLVINLAIHLCLWPG